MSGPPATKVSVIIPVFDREAYVEESLESVLATEYPALEVVVVDDGSTDRSSAILGEIRERNPDVVRVFRHPGGRNLGSPRSRNLGLAAADGEYVCFLDSDDIMLPHRFDRSVALLDEDSSLDGVVEVTELLFEDDAERERWGDRRRRYGPLAASIAADGFLSACLLERSCSMHTSNILVRAGLFAKAGLFRATRELSEDFHLWLRMAACGRFAVGETTRPVTLYRRHRGNIWKPGALDSVRDVGVLRDVLVWARRSPHVAPANVAALGRAYREKARWCIGRMGSGEGRSAAMRFASRLVARDLRWALDPGFAAGLARAILRPDGTRSPRTQTA